jgi:hypothetical protein
MSFWQGSTGQGVITNAASAKNGICTSVRWLRQYAPFQDLSTKATCSQVATYVLNVSNAAGASGASMNALLKGQTLATALDIYFSDPALGGNAIGAPAPIGAVKIDLTRICATYATGGSCAAFENSTSAFGGAACQSVSQTLSYAAKQSNSGGGLWYGNVQATQNLAKDAFDAVNRQQVFGCL